LLRLNPFPKVEWSKTDKGGSPCGEQNTVATLLAPPFSKVDLQKEYHITSSIKIGEVLLGRLKSSAGFVFKYK